MGAVYGVLRVYADAVFGGVVHKKHKIHSDIHFVSKITGKTLLKVHNRVNNSEYSENPGLISARKTKKGYLWTK